MDDPEAVIEDLVYQCLAARDAADPEAVERLLADQPSEIREQVAAMLGTLDRVGLAGEAVPNPSDAKALPFGPYLLLERLGAGAMGVVYRARDPSGIERALKLLQPGLLPVRRARLRFEREIQALRQLDHRGICPILDAGDVDGVPFLVMPLLQGESLQARYARGRARDDEARRQLLLIVEQVALALHHAHERGFVHRDVKPANILVDADGRAVVLDFGLARLDRDDAATLSQSHEVIGAPAYMAPEQIADGGTVDRRADVYALGVLLYEGLTGHCPYEAATRESLYRRILTGDVEPPSRRIGDLPAALDVVCLTALARDADRRYQTAAAFAADLERARVGERPHAQLPGVFERVGRWVRRNPLPSTLVAALVLATLALSWQTIREHLVSARDRARVLTAEAFEVLPSDPQRAEQLARQAHSLAPDLTETLTAIEAALTAEREEFVLTGHTLPVTDLEFSTDGERLVSASLDGTARIWGLRDGTSVPLRHGSDGSALARFQPGGDLVVTAGRSDGRLCAWDAKSGALQWERRAHARGHAVSVLNWSPDGRWVLTGGVGGARVWAADGTSRELTTTPAAVTAATWLGDDRVLLGSGPVTAADPPSEHWLRTFRIEVDTVVADSGILFEDGVVSLHPRPPVPDHVLVVDSSSTAWMWTPGAASATRLPRPQARGICTAGWHGGGDYAITVGPAGGLGFFTPEGKSHRPAVSTQSRILGFVPHPRQAFAAISMGGGGVLMRSFEGAGSLWLGRKRLRPLALAFSPRGEWFAACDWNHALHVWATWRPQHPMFFAGDEVRSVIWSRDGRRVITGSRRRWSEMGLQTGVLRSWDVATGQLVGRAVEVDGQVTTLMPCALRDEVIALFGRWDAGGVLVAADLDGELRPAKATIGGDVLTRLPADGEVLRDGRIVAVGEEGGLFVCDIAARAIATRWQLAPTAADSVGTGYQSALAATPCGTTIWCGGTSGFLHRFDRSPGGAYAESGTRQMGDYIRALSCLDDGSLLLGLANGILQRLLRDGTVIPFAGHRDDVCDVDWTKATGELLIASADDSGSVRLWRGDGTLLREIRAHRDTVWSVRFSPDGHRVLTGSADGTARIWRVLLDVGR